MGNKSLIKSKKIRFWPFLDAKAQPSLLMVFNASTALVNRESNIFLPYKIKN